MKQGNKIAELQSENENIFLREALENYIMWKSKALELQKADKDATMELMYASTFRMQLNAFTSESKNKE
jgi:hypothetical protein